MPAIKAPIPQKPSTQIFAWVAIFFVLFLLYQSVQKTEVREIPYSTFKQQLAAGKLKKVTLASDAIKGEFEEQGKDVYFKTVPMPVSDTKLVEELTAAKVEYKAVPDKTWITSLLFNLGWIALLIFLWWFLFLRQAASSGRQAMSFGKTRAKQQDLTKQKITFADVAGVDEAKEELQDVVAFLRNPKRFQKLGGKLPKGVLLYGPPGTGKTLLAKAVAGEAGVPFFTTSGSEFIELYVGVGASRVRDLFEQAKKNAPAIVFIDELDAVGRHRFAGLGGGHDEREQTLNQLLIELDGFESTGNIILMGSTNRPDVLDPALVRPGRFDRQVQVAVPDVKGREQILQVHAKKIKTAHSVNLKTVAKQTPGFVGADLANIVNEAAILAARANKNAAGMPDFEEAIERTVAGPQRKSRVITEKEKNIIAYHESGHTVVAKYLTGADPVHKVSIISRGHALGYTMQLPEQDKYLVTKTEIINRLCILLGGRAAEEIVFGEVTTGATDDLSKVTVYAQKMVAEFGMSKTLGPISLKQEDHEVFLGKDIGRQRSYSDETARTIDEEVSRVINECYDRVKRLLSEHRDALDALTKRLIEKETVSAKEIDLIIGNPSHQFVEEAPEPEEIDEETQEELTGEGAVEEETVSVKEAKQKKRKPKAEKPETNQTDAQKEESNNG